MSDRRLAPPSGWPPPPEYRDADDAKGHVVVPELDARLRQVAAVVRSLA